MWPVVRLRPYVDAVIAYDERAWGHRVARHEVPRAGALLLLQLAPVLELGEAGRSMPQSFVVGGMGTRVTPTAFDHHQCGIEVALSPLGARAVLGVDGYELAGRTIPLADLVDDAEALANRLRESATWHDRLALVERWLRDRLANARADLRLATWLCAQLEATGGNAAIHALVRQSGYSHGYVTRLCTRQLGAGPKDLACAIRFGRVVQGLRRSPALPNLAGLAAELGYTDHSHLVREVRRFTGIPPRELHRILAPALHPLSGAANLSKPPPSPPGTPAA